MIIPKPGEPIALGEFFLEERRFSAVYFLYHRGQVVYVGQTRTLLFRINQHLEQGAKVFDAVAFIRCTIDKLTAIECHYIRELAPKYNACNLSKKMRERDSWKRDESRRALRDRKASVWADPRDIDTTKDLEFSDAADCVLNPREVADFLGVTEGDAATFYADGKVVDTPLMSLLYMAALNRKVRTAQDRFEDL